MTTMKALRFEKYGPPSILSLQELPTPVPKPGEALVELYASAINPSDVKNVAGVFKASLPRIPGRDYAGVVVAGEGWVGKQVWGSGAGFGVLIVTLVIGGSLWIMANLNHNMLPMARVMDMQR